MSDARSSFANLTLVGQGPLDFNFRTAQNATGRLFFVSVGIDPTLKVTSVSNTQNTGNQINIRDSQFTNGLTINGMNAAVFASWIASGTLTLNAQSDTETLLNLVGGGINGNVVVNVQSGEDIG